MYRVRYLVPEVGHPITDLLRSELGTFAWIPTKCLLSYLVSSDLEYNLQMRGYKI